MILHALFYGKIKRCMAAFCFFQVAVIIKCYVACYYFVFIKQNQLLYTQEARKAAKNTKRR